MPQVIGAAMRPKGSPPATAPYSASVPWAVRLNQGEPVALSNQLNKGMRAEPAIMSTARFFRNWPTAPSSEPMPDAPSRTESELLSPSISAPESAESPAMS